MLAVRLWLLLLLQPLPLKGKHQYPMSLGVVIPRLGTAALDSYIYFFLRSKTQGTMLINFPALG